MAPAPVATWTGCYIGGNIGGAFGNASASAPGGEVSGDGSGFAGGGQVGCDYEFGGGFVIGARELLDYTSNNRSGTITSGTLAGTVVNFNNQWFDPLRVASAMRCNPVGCFTFRAAPRGLIQVRTSAVELLLARHQTPEPAGRSVVALNGCSHRTGRRFSKVTIWTSAQIQEM